MRIDRLKFICLLADKEVSIKEIAEKTGLSRATVSGVKSGKGCSPETIGKIAKVLDVEVRELLCES